MRIVAHFLSWPLYTRANLLNSAYAHRVRTTFEARLLEAVAQEPRALELAFSNRTAADLTAWMAEDTGIAIGPRHVGDHLKAYSWRPRRPVRTDKHRQHDVAGQVSLLPTITPWISAMAYLRRWESTDLVIGWVMRLTAHRFAERMRLPKG